MAWFFFLQGIGQGGWRFESGDSPRLRFRRGDAPRRNRAAEPDLVAFQPLRIDLGKQARDE